MYSDRYTSVCIDMCIDVPSTVIRYNMFSSFDAHVTFTFSSKLVRCTVFSKRISYKTTFARAENL